MSVLLSEEWAWIVLVDIHIFADASWVGSVNYFFFFQAEDGIRDAQESRGLGDVYKRQPLSRTACLSHSW